MWIIHCNFMSCAILAVRPTVRPSVRPSARPSDRPSDRPSVRPTVRPSVRPSDGPVPVARLLRPTAQKSAQQASKCPTSRHPKESFLKSSQPNRPRSAQQASKCPTGFKIQLTDEIKLIHVSMKTEKVYETKARIDEH